MSPSGSQVMPQGTGMPSATVSVRKPGWFCARAAGRVSVINNVVIQRSATGMISILVRAERHCNGTGRVRQRRHLSDRGKQGPVTEMRREIVQYQLTHGAPCLCRSAADMREKH